jgi:hypothetical protein
MAFHHRDAPCMRRTWRRWFASTAIILAVALGGCNGSNGSPTSPTRVSPSPPPPASAKLSGTITAKTTLTATGGYQYTVEIQLAEIAGVTATITAVGLVHMDAWGPYPPLVTFGSEAWNGSTIVPAHGTLTSKSLVATEEVIFNDSPVGAVITFSDATATTSRTIELMDATQRMPEPPPNSRFILMGTVVDALNHALRDVTVDVLKGANAGSKVTTDENGTFILADLRPDTFSVRFSKADYISTSTSVNLKSNSSLRYMLLKGN